MIWKIPDEYSSSLKNKKDNNQNNISQSSLISRFSRSIRSKSQKSSTNIAYVIFIRLLIILLAFIFSLWFLCGFYKVNNNYLLVSVLYRPYVVKSNQIDWRPIFLSYTIEIAKNFDSEDELLAITHDNQNIRLNLTLHCSVTNPLQYIKFANTADQIKSLINDRIMDDLSKINYNELSIDNLKEKSKNWQWLNLVSENYGITITSIDFIDLNRNKNRTNNLVGSESNNINSKANKILDNARLYANNIINNTNSEITGFNNLLVNYSKYSDIAKIQFSKKCFEEITADENSNIGADKNNESDNSNENYNDEYSTKYNGSDFEYDSDQAGY